MKKINKVNNKKNIKNYSINNLNEKQLSLIKNALEFYTRFLFGQVDNIPNELFIELKGINHEKKDQVFGDLKKLLFSELSHNQSYGVGNYKEGTSKYSGQVGYELYKYIAKFLYDISENKNTYDVDAQGPLHYSKENKIKIESNNNLNIHTFKKVDNLDGLKF